MDYQKAINAICLGDLKQAALYFDRVLPIAFVRMQGTGTGVLVYAPDELPAEVFASLVYGKGAPGHKVLGYLQDHWQPFIMKVVKRLGPTPQPVHFPYDEVRRLYLQNHCTQELGSIRDEFAAFAKGLSFEYAAAVLPAVDEENLAFEQAYAVVSLSGLPMVNVSRAPWEQIMQLREDEQSASKLRRLRLLVHENYIGKPRSYVEDDIAQRVEDFERARKALGFEVVVSTISVVLDSKALQASAAAGLVGALFGGPVAALGAAAAVEIGKVSIELAKRRQAIRDLEQGHAIGFIATAKDHLQ